MTIPIHCVDSEFIVHLLHDHDVVPDGGFDFADMTGETISRQRRNEFTRINISFISSG